MVVDTSAGLVVLGGVVVGVDAKAQWGRARTLETVIIITPDGGVGQTSARMKCILTGVSVEKLGCRSFVGLVQFLGATLVLQTIDLKLRVAHMFFKCFVLARPPDLSLRKLLDGRG